MDGKIDDNDISDPLSHNATVIVISGSISNDPTGTTDDQWAPATLSFKQCPPTAQEITSSLEREDLTLIVAQGGSCGFGGRFGTGGICDNSELLPRAIWESLRSIQGGILTDSWPEDVGHTRAGRSVVLPVVEEGLFRLEMECARVRRDIDCFDGTGNNDGREVGEGDCNNAIFTTSRVSAFIYRISQSNSQRSHSSDSPQSCRDRYLILLLSPVTFIHPQALLHRYTASSLRRWHRLVLNPLYIALDTFHICSDWSCLLEFLLESLEQIESKSSIERNHPSVLQIKEIHDQVGKCIKIRDILRVQKAVMLRILSISHSLEAASDCSFDGRLKGLVDIIDHYLLNIETILSQYSNLESRLYNLIVIEQGVSVSKITTLAFLFVPLSFLAAVFKIEIDVQKRYWAAILVPFVFLTLVSVAYGDMRRVAVSFFERWSLSELWRRSRKRKDTEQEKENGLGTGLSQGTPSAGMARASIQRTFSHCTETKSIPTTIEIPILLPARSFQPAAFYSFTPNTTTTASASSSSISSRRRTRILPDEHLTRSPPSLSPENSDLTNKPTPRAPANAHARAMTGSIMSTEAKERIGPLRAMSGSGAGVHVRFVRDGSALGSMQMGFG